MTVQPPERPLCAEQADFSTSCRQALPGKHSGQCTRGAQPPVSVDSTSVVSQPSTAKLMLSTTQGKLTACVLAYG